jgi:hypothetical protein
VTPPFTAPFSALGRFQDLCDYLHEEDVAHTADVDAHAVEITTRVGALLGTMVVRWEWHRQLVQIIQVVLVDIPAERVPAVEHALAVLNHAAPIAGFALDPERRFVYFRITMQRDERDLVTVPQLNRALRAAVSSATEALPLLLPIAAPSAAA